MNNLDNKNVAYFMMPGFCEHKELYKNMAIFFDRYPEARRENTEIYCYYGNVPFCTWDGGRIFYHYQPLSYEELIELKQLYIDTLHGKIRFIFTNGLIQSEHCYEHYNNFVLSVFKDTEGEIVVNSPILKDYLKETYPEYSLISSTTKCLINADDAVSEIGNPDYKFICLDYNLNHNWNMLNIIPEEQRNKVEILVNAICGPACSYRKEHYRLNSLYSLSCGQPYAMRGCMIDKNNLYPNGNSTKVTIDEIMSKYVPNGYHYFKIEGRSFSNEYLATTLAEYLIKPEYQLFFIADMMTNIKPGKEN